MPKTKSARPESARPRFRLNSVFFKLLALIVVASVVLAAVTSITYTRASLAQIEARVAQGALETNDLLAGLLSGSVISRAPGPIERELQRLSQGETTPFRHGLAIDGNGMVIAENGLDDTRQEALSALATRAVESEERQVSPDGLMVANPIRNMMSGKTVGALATAWSDESAIESALTAQLPVVLAALVAMVLVTGVMMFFIRSMLVKPIADVVGAVDRMAAQQIDTEVATRSRGDELGDIGKALEVLRLQLVRNREEARENRFRGTAFLSSSAAIMMVDSEMNISSVNATLDQILTHYAEDFRQVSATFDPEHVIGQPMDTFHPGAMRERVRRILEDPKNLPFKTDIAVGDARFHLTINQVVDELGVREGFVVEWNDTTAEFMNSAMLAAIEANQIKAEFGLDGTLLHANAHFQRALGVDSDADLLGQSKDALFAFDDALAAERGSVFDRLNAGDSVYGSFQLKRKDQSEVIIDGGFTPVLDGGGRLLRVILIGNDTTQAKRALRMAEAERLSMIETQAGIVDSLRLALEQLAEGDLTSRIETEFPKENDQLRVDFNTAVGRLQEAMRGVIENADLIRGEVAEIASAADDLSGRTERQAATLEQTASALDELTSSVKSAADGAAHANALVDDARSNAEASGDVVRQAVEAMGEIESSSQQISRITGVIDDIAFQTNLLALNAGVEAARAGEAGRGFAVVASEVRALAQRSSDAAREINGLISASGEQVKRGVDLVDQAGTALRGIVENVKKISQNVGEIATSSQEQSTGLGEINAAVNQLDQVTQQNAAMFEQTTAASHALTRETETLTTTMGRFQIGLPSGDTKNVVVAEFSSNRADIAETKPVAPSLPAVSGGAQAVAVEEDDGWDEF
ncbi:MAG TPA: PAS domain-containing protein [Rhodobacterales bacterium]|nr:PAS domain-containing protein [Rhodobacterales bacterium]